MDIDGPKAAGCLVTAHDGPRICASCAVYCCNIAFGGGVAILGASIAFLSTELGIPDTMMGQMFTCRGVGVFLGALFASALFKTAIVPLSKHMICCIAINLSGLALGMIVLMLSRFEGNLLFPVRVAFIIQGIGFGLVDSYTIVALSEMWGQRVQPWMQTRNLMFSVGGLIAPVLVSRVGYRWGMMSLCLIGFASFTFILSQQLLLFVFPQEGDQYNNHGGTTGSTASQSDSSERDQRVLPLMGSCTRCGNVEPMLANELETLNYAIGRIEEKHDIELSHNDSYSNLVHIVLEHSEYSDIAQIDRDDPEYQYPHINRTLSYASSAVENFVRMEGEEGVSIGVTFLPNTAALSLTVFVIIYVGLYYSFGGWINTYADNQNITYEANGVALPAGLYLSSVYYGCIMLGCLASIPVSAFVSSTMLIRTQLMILLIGGCTMLIPVSAFHSTFIGAAAIGYALSSIYGLTMTVANDYGFTMDSATTAMLVMAGCAGESFVPILVGQLMRYFGPKSFLLFTSVAIAVMLGTYYSLHLSLSSAMRKSQSKTALEDLDKVIQHAETRARSLSRTRREDVIIQNHHSQLKSDYQLLPQQSERKYREYGALDDMTAEGDEWIEMIVQRKMQLQDRSNTHTNDA